MSQAKDPQAVANSKGMEPSSTLDGGVALGGMTVDTYSNDDLKHILSPAVIGGELGWIAHYKVVRVLGRGGMGMVLEAEDTRLQRRVAIKVMLPEIAQNPITRDRFLLEARAIAKLKSDHVVTIYDVGQERDVPYLAMEFLRGETLDRRLARSTFPLSEILRVAREIAAGLAAAHEAGLIHRDIKPGNIWLEAPSDRVKILDFGLVRNQQAAKDQLTRTGNILGTPHFMSPEQARGQTLDARSDLFSMGVVLYHLCTNQLPFQGDSLMAVLTSLAVDAPPPITQANPTIPAPLAELVASLLEKAPDKRPGSAREVIERLEIIEGKTACHGHGATQIREVAALQSTAPRMGVPTGVAPTDSTRLAWVLAAVVAILGLSSLAIAPWVFSFFASPPPPPGAPLTIGILHSKTGTMKISERPVINAVLFAIHEINEQGGVLGRQLQAVIEDGQSDENVFAQRAEKLIVEDKVVTIFGCWTSASRKAVKPIIEKHNHLLAYPVSYEGMELSNNILYGGSVPNQQILPALRWAFGFPAKRWYLVGSDYVFPHAANEVIKDEARRLGAEIVGEKYMILGLGDFGPIAEDIAKVQPDLILNTLNGDSNVSFFRTLRAHGVQSDKTPTISFSISDAELSDLRIANYVGDYCATSYLETIDSPRNKQFVKAFRASYGEEARISDGMQTAYCNVHMWAEAVKNAGRTDANAIRASLKGLTFDAPQGKIEIDRENLHIIQQARIGKFLSDGTVEEQYLTPLIRPEPYPASRSREAWDDLLNKLYLSWDNHWAKQRN